MIKIANSDTNFLIIEEEIELQRKAMKEYKGDKNICFRCGVIKPLLRPAFRKEEDDTFTVLFFLCKKCYPEPITDSNKLKIMEPPISIVDPWSGTIIRDLS